MFSSHLMPYLPGLADLASLAAVVAVAAGFAGLGLLLNLGRQPAEVLLISGWGVTLMAATLFGVLTASPLVWILYPALALGAAGWALRWRTHAEERADCVRVLAIGLTTLVIVSAASASQWDEFAHWLVNQRYLVEVGTFPRRGLPESPTIFAAYPYGLPLVGFLASRLTGGFAENAGALLNTLLILVLALAVVRAFRTETGTSLQPLSWMECAAGFLAATLLNPTFVPKLVFTTYADWTTAVVLGVAVMAGWRLLEAAAADRLAEARSAALHIGLAAALLVSLKQPNVILVVLLFAGLAFSAIATTRISVWALALLGLRLVGPVLVIYLAWRYHVLNHLPGREFSFLPLSGWLWDDLGSILTRMALIASKKGGYFGLMLAAVGVAVYGAAGALRGRPVSALARLAIIVAIMFVGYNAFLYVAYVGAFGAGEGRSAASYWRYNTQLGGAALIFGAAALGALYRRYSTAVSLPRFARTGVIAVALIMPVFLAVKIRFDLNPVTRYVRSVGTEIAQLLPAGSTLLVVDPGGNGKRAMLIRYEVPTARVERTEEFASAAAVQGAIAALGREAFLWVHESKPAIIQALGIDLAPLSSSLVGRSGDGWRIIRSWPYPGYTDPADEDD